MTDCPSSTQTALAFSSASGSRRQTILLCLALVLVTFLAFAPVMSFDFIACDDSAYLTENPLIRQGLTRDGVAQAFEHTQLGLWHPLSALFFMAGVDCFGLNPFAFHLLNLSIHAVSVVLVFLLLQTLMASTWRSALVAALFGIHPLRVESVAWVSELKDVLSVLFVLLAMLAYVAYVRRGGWWRYGLIVVTLVLSLLAKPMFITFPAIQNSGSRDAWLYLGMALSKRNELPEALYCFKQLVAVAPRDPMAHLNVAFVLNQLGQPEQAAARCRAALAINPKMASAHYALGLSLLKLERPTEAMAELQRSLELAPDDTQVQAAMDQARAKLRHRD